MNNEDVKAVEQANAIEKEVEANKEVVNFDLTVGGYSLQQTLGLRRWCLAQHARYLRKAGRAWRGHTRQAFFAKAEDYHRQFREHSIRLAQYEIKFRDLGKVLQAKE